MWKVTTTDLNKLDVFHHMCLRRVLRRFWPNHLSNKEKYEATDPSVSPHTSEKIAMDRAFIEEKSQQHLGDCTDVCT